MSNVPVNPPNHQEPSTLTDFLKEVGPMEKVPCVEVTVDIFNYRCSSCGQVWRREEPRVQSFRCLARDRGCQGTAYTID